jgi:hypothetical protein
MTDGNLWTGLSVWIDAQVGDVIETLRSPERIAEWFVQVAVMPDDDAPMTVRFPNGWSGRVHHIVAGDEDRVLLAVELADTDPRLSVFLVTARPFRGGTHVTSTHLWSTNQRFDREELTKLIGDGEWDMNRTKYAAAEGGWVETKVWNSREQLERFEIEPGSRQGPLRIERDLLLRGCVTGDVVVPSGKRLQINGAVLGNVTVEQGAQVEVNGFVRDTLRVNGGRAVIRGIVDGEIFDEAEAELIIEATAFVGGHAVAS